MTPRKRRMMIGFAALVLAMWLVVALIFAITGDVQTDISVQAGEASAEVALGNLQCEKTFSQSFPFFKMVCQDDSTLADALNTAI